MRLKRGGGGNGKGGRPVLYFTGAVKFRIWFSPPPLPRSHGIATVVVVVRTEIYTRWWVQNIQRGVSSSTGLKCQIAWVRWRESDSGQNWPKEEVALKINFFKALFVRLG